MHIFACPTQTPAARPLLGPALSLSHAELAISCVLMFFCVDSRVLAWGHQTHFDLWSKPGFKPWSPALNGCQFNAPKPYGYFVSQKLKTLLHRDSISQPQHESMPRSGTQHFTENRPLQSQCITEWHKYYYSLFPHKKPSLTYGLPWQTYPFGNFVASLITGGYWNCSKTGTNYNKDEVPHFEQ